MPPKELARLEPQGFDLMPMDDVPQILDAAQRCEQRFIAEHRLSTQPATSNAAACRDLIPGEIAFGPAICGELYDITRIGTAIQDYQGAATDFLVLAPRAKSHGCSPNHAPKLTSNTNRY